MTNKPVIIISKTDLFKSGAVASDLAWATLAAANGKAAKFTYNAPDLIRIARLAEQRMDQGNILERDRVGFTVTARSAGPVAAAYKSTAIGSLVTMVRTAKGWSLTAAAQATVYPKMSDKVTFTVCAKLADAFRERATFDLKVAPAEMDRVLKRAHSDIDGRYGVSDEEPDGSDAVFGHCRPQ